jgi:prepilin-type N-terminal cleavage/methylation domain-containing protein
MRLHIFDRRKQGGFSLVELLVVVAIILTISAVAAPNVMRTLNAYRLRSAIHSQAELIQRARMEALRDNRIKHLWYQWQWDGGAWRTSFFIDDNGNWWQEPTETIQYPLPNYMFWGWGPSTASMNLDFTPQSTGMLPSFDARGLPCWFNSANDCSTMVGGQPVGFVFYMEYVEKGWWDWSELSYAAISVSPSGKVRTYTWDGNTWQQ